MFIKRVFLCLFSLYAISGYADINKCKDANGHISYSRTACVNKSDSKIIPEAEANIPQKKADSTLTKENNNLSEPEQPAQDIPVSETPIKQKRPSHNNRQFRCDGRVYCSQMRSCEEATFFIEHCPNTKMDGDEDGIPCETQWCGY